MISTVVLVLICVAGSQNAMFFVNAHESQWNPVNLKLTKLLDVKVESKADYLRNDLNRILQGDESNTEKRDEYLQIPMKFSFGVDGTNNKQFCEDGFENIFQGCKSLVGRSQIPFCQFNPSQHKDVNLNSYPRSCREILDNGNNKSGIYEIKPRTSRKPFSVLCDMELKGGGWTYIQKRFDGSQDFYLPWRDYKFGFGNLDGEFWMGLENIYHMTGFESNELYIELTDRDKKTAYAKYATFSIGPEQDGYILKVLNGFSGDAGDALTPHVNFKFSTFDVDQDIHASNCAQICEGGWWYTNCHSSNLNGKHMNKVLPDAYKHHGLNWNGFKPLDYNLAASKMLIRPVGE